MDVVNLNERVTLILNNVPHTVFLDAFFMLMSFRGPFVFLWGLVVLYIVMHYRKEVMCMLKPLLLSTVGAYLIADILKSVFIKPRPYLSHIKDQFIIVGSSPSSYTMPSGHAAFAFAGATILASYFPRFRYVFVISAVLIAYSRIYLGYHYVSDVIVGAIIGVLTGWTVAHVKIK